MSTRKQEKETKSLASRLRYLLSKEEITETIERIKNEKPEKGAFSGYNRRNREKRAENLRDQLKLHHLLEQLGISTDEDKKKYMARLSFRRNQRHREYSKRPPKVKKDNSLSLNMYGETDYGKWVHEQNPNLRFPSKKRKTAWKRFYKLFPNLKPKGE